MGTKPGLYALYLQLVDKSVLFQIICFAGVQMPSPVQINSIRLM